MQYAHQIYRLKILFKNIRTARRKRSFTKYKMIKARTKTQNRFTTTFNTLKASHKIISPAKKAMMGFLIRSFIFSCFVLMRLQSWFPVRHLNHFNTGNEAKNEGEKTRCPKFVGDNPGISDKVRYSSR